MQVATIISNATASHIPDARLGAVSSGLALLSYLFAAALHHYSGIKAKRSSSTLLFFWLFSIIASIITIRTKAALHFPDLALPSFVLQCLTLVLQVVIFSLECLQPDTSSGYIKLGEDVRRNEVPYI